MPITSKGREVLKNMVKQYGSKKGQEVFYASINAGKPGSSEWHGGSKKKKHKENKYSKHMKAGY